MIGGCGVHVPLEANLSKVSCRFNMLCTSSKHWVAQSLCDVSVNWCLHVEVSHWVLSRKATSASPLEAAQCGISSSQSQGQGQQLSSPRVCGCSFIHRRTEVGKSSTPSSSNSSSSSSTFFLISNITARAWRVI